MTNTEMLIHKFFRLPEHHQQKILIFIDTLAEPQVSVKAPIDPYGMCADFCTDLSFEEFKQNRREMWSGQPREENLL